MHASVQLCGGSGGNCGRGGLLGRGGGEGGSGGGEGGGGEGGGGEGEGEGGGGGLAGGGREASTRTRQDVASERKLSARGSVQPTTALGHVQALQSGSVANGS